MHQVWLATKQGSHFGFLYEGDEWLRSQQKTFTSLLEQVRREAGEAVSFHWANAG